MFMTFLRGVFRLCSFRALALAIFVLCASGWIVDGNRDTEFGGFEDSAARHLMYGKPHESMHSSRYVNKSPDNKEHIIDRDSGFPGNINTSLYLVVSHCKHSLQWISNLTSAFNFNDITIFSKCGFPVIEAPSGSRIKILPNVGRCDHTYAHYISTELNATNGVVLFVKDTTHIHNTLDIARLRGMNNRRSYQTMLEAAAGTAKFSCRQFVDSNIGVSNEAISKYLLKYSLPKYNMSIHNYSNVQGAEHFSKYSDMQAWTTTVGVRLPQPLTPVCYGGIFAANIERLLAVDMSVWRNIRHSLSRADNIEEGHFMERSWAGLLSIEPMPEIYLQKFLNNTAQCFRRNICGYRGHIIQSREKIQSKRKQRLCLGVSRAKVNSGIKPCPAYLNTSKRKRRSRTNHISSQGVTSSPLFSIT